MKLEQVLTTVDGVMGHLVKFLLGFVSLSVLGEVIFGQGIFGTSVVENIMGIIGTMGDGGFVGLVALLILAALFDRK